MDVDGTDSPFKNRRNLERVSLLESANFDMVSQVPMEHVHGVGLGVIKKKVKYNFF